MMRKQRIKYFIKILFGWFTSNIAWGIFSFFFSAIVYFLSTKYLNLDLSKYINNLKDPEALSKIVNFIIFTVVFIIMFIPFKWYITRFRNYYFKNFLNHDNELKEYKFYFEKDTELAYLNSIIQSENKKSITWIVFKNKSRKPIEGCIIYLSKVTFGKEQWDFYDSKVLRRKPLKWIRAVRSIEEEINSPFGPQIKILPGEKISLEIARIVKIPKVKMEISYYDGYYGEFIKPGYYKFALDIHFLINNYPRKVSSNEIVLRFNDQFLLEIVSISETKDNGNL